VIDNWQYSNTKQNFLEAVPLFDFDKDLNIHIPVQSTTLVAFDYRKNEYKELNTWGQTLPLSPPFNLWQHKASTLPMILFNRL
jgi:hypothetical protein